MNTRQKIINKLFEKQGENGFWKTLSESDKYYPELMHYVPNFKSTLWTLILLADLACDRKETRVKQALEEIKEHFFDPKYGIYSIGKSHFPIPCLNGNMIYLDCYFNGKPSRKSLKALAFFYKYQRFDDGCYVGEKNDFCKNTSCYGKHSCYWGVVKLFKGISFVPKEFRTAEINDLLARCIDFVLLHKVCYSSHKEGKIMIKGMDKLTFPNMYKSDFLEILWLLKREKIKSEKIKPALALLQSKQQDGSWYLERKIHNMIAGVGTINRPNELVSERAKEVLDYYHEFTN